MCKDKNNNNLPTFMQDSLVYLKFLYLGTLFPCFILSQNCNIYNFGTTIH